MGCRSLLLFYGGVKRSCRLRLRNSPALLLPCRVLHRCTAAPDTRMSSMKVLGLEDPESIILFLNPNTSSSKITPPFPVPNTWCGFHPLLLESLSLSLQHFRLKHSPQKDTLHPTSSPDLWGKKKKPGGKVTPVPESLHGTRQDTACPVTSTQALRLVFPECVSCCFH